MAKIKKREEKGGGAAWMNTFSDLMNLLLCFFVMLFAMSDPNQEKFQQLSASLASTFSIFNAGSVSMGDGVLIGSGASQLNELAIYYNNMGMNSEGEITQEEIKDAAQQIQEAGLQESEHMAENIEKQLEQNMLSDDVEVKATSKYVMLNLNSGILFDSGKSELKTEAVTLLDKVSSILWEYNDNMIAIAIRITILFIIQNILTIRCFHFTELILYSHILRIRRDLMHQRCLQPEEENQFL